MAFSAIWPNDCLIGGGLRDRAKVVGLFRDSDVRLSMVVEYYQLHPRWKHGGMEYSQQYIKVSSNAKQCSVMSASM